MERRVEILEERTVRIEATLTRLEPKIVETLTLCAKQSELSSARVESANAIAGVRADLARLVGDLGEVKGKVSSLPTTWMLITALLSTWAIGAGIVFALLKSAK